MPPLENMIFEFTALLLAFTALMRLWRDPNKFFFMSFLFAVVVTTLIELAGVRLEHSYYYADFLFEIPAVPILAGLGGKAAESAGSFPVFVAFEWAFIIYCLNLMMKKLYIAWYLAPLVCGLVAVSIDMALDPVAASSRMVAAVGESCFDSTVPGSAEGIGYWVWCIPENTPNSYFFGVPLQNFYAWFLVVAVWMLFQSVAFKISYEGPWYAQFNALMTSTVLSLVLFFTILGDFLALGAGFAWLVWGTLMFLGMAVLVNAGTKRVNYVMDWWAYSVLIASSLFCVLGIIINLWSTSSISLKLSTALWVVFGMALGAWILLGKRLLDGIHKKYDGNENTVGHD